MLDISTDIDKAVVFGPEGVLASNMSEPALSATVAQAEALVRLGQASAEKMGSQPLTQMVVEDAGGARVPGPGDRGGRHDGRGHRQEGQPGRPGSVRSQDLPARRAGSGRQERDYRRGGLDETLSSSSSASSPSWAAWRAGAYYFFFVRSRNPQVELYFDDGSMLAFPGNTGEAEPSSPPPARSSLRARFRTESRRLS